VWAGTLQQRGLELTLRVKGVQRQGNDVCRPAPGGVPDVLFANV
jgi:hypothetical protein